MVEIFRNEHLVAWRDAMGGLVRVARTSSEFLQLEDVEDSYQAMFRAIDRSSRTRFALLVDLRDSPRRSDPRFESVMRRIRPLLFRRFKRGGVLVRSSGGVRQLTQHTQEDGISVMVSTSESELLLFLSEGKLDRG